LLQLAGMAQAAGQYRQTHRYSLKPKLSHQAFTL
jgi:hypothetical protein